LSFMKNKVALKIVSHCAEPEITAQAADEMESGKELKDLLQPIGATFHTSHKRDGSSTIVIQWKFSD